MKIPFYVNPKKNEKGSKKNSLEKVNNNAKNAYYLFIEIIPRILTGQM